MNNDLLFTQLPIDFFFPVKSALFSFKKDNFKFV